MDLARIRNFSIIAHIDHGKSTLSDRILEITKAVDARDMKAQYLDSMDLERERGITIKAQNVRVEWNGHVFHLIDTPGHVDFGYEVSRSLAACEGVVLVVDAAQGIEAQTLANCYLALEHDLEIVACLNKIDLPAADPDRVKAQIEEVIGLDASNAIEISAKTGMGVPDVLEAIVTRLPPPKGDANAPLKALLVDSWYDAYLGVVVLVRIIDGTLSKGQRIRLMLTGGTYQVDRVGIFRPKQEMRHSLGPGEIGFFTASIRQVADTRVGDTITDDRRPAADALPGFRPAQPVVFCGLFPVDAADFENLRAAIGSDDFPPLLGNQAQSTAPDRAFMTADKREIGISATNEEEWQALCKARPVYGSPAAQEASAITTVSTGPVPACLSESSTVVGSPAGAMTFTSSATHCPRG